MTGNCNKRTMYQAVMINKRNINLINGSGSNKDKEHIYFCFIPEGNEMMIETSVEVVIDGSEPGKKCFIHYCIKCSI